MLRLRSWGLEKVQRAVSPLPTLVSCFACALVGVCKCFTGECGVGQWYAALLLWEGGGGRGGGDQQPLVHSCFGVPRACSGRDQNFASRAGFKKMLGERQYFVAET